MSRGRHRHSSLLGRTLAPVASGVLVVAAVAAVVVSPDQLVARSAGVAAICATVGLCVLMRQRDKAARAAAQLAVTRRIRDEERFEEQLAEAEYAAEVAEERATRLGRRLTAEKSRLAKAETEIARLLRERAVLVAEQAMKDAEAARKAKEAAGPKHPVTTAAFVKAAAALRNLERRADAAEARAAGADLELRPKTPHPVPSGAARFDAERSGEARDDRTAAALRPVPATPVAVPTGQRPRTGFSFFGTPPRPRAALRPAAPVPSVGDLADVVGDEAMAASERYAEQDARPAEPVAAPEPVVEPVVEHLAEPAVPAVQVRPALVDLTAEDETELLELPGLRAGRS